MALRRIAEYNETIRLEKGVKILEFLKGCCECRDARFERKNAEVYRGLFIYWGTGKGVKISARNNGIYLRIMEYTEGNGADVLA